MAAGSQPKRVRKTQPQAPKKQKEVHQPPAPPAPVAQPVAPTQVNLEVIDFFLECYRIYLF